MKQLFIHCGLHKTGSTALQSWLSEHDNHLPAHNLLYPKTGRIAAVGGGHHNIAWQIAGDRRFNQHFGKLVDLLEEIAAFDGTVVLSSEDFESMLGTGPKIARLLAAFASCKVAPVFVIYLRNQIDYSESLFFENLGQGSATAYGACIAQIFRDGRFRVKDWVFQFAYRQMLDNMTRAGAAFIVRNFHALDHDSVIRDFMNVIGAGEAGLLGATAATPSRRPALRAAIAMFYGNAAGRPMVPREQNCARLIAEAIDISRTGTSAAGRQKFQEMFMADNLALCAGSRLSAAGLDFQNARAGRPDAADETCYERIFSLRTMHLLDEMRALIDAQDLDGAVRCAQEHFQLYKDAALPSRQTQGRLTAFPERL